jgi:hypothetical protein
MPRVTPVGWALVAGIAVTALLAIVAPGAGLVAAIALALVAMATAAEGFFGAAGWFDVGIASDRKREALTRDLRLGRRRWERTAPDHADEPPDAIWERERRRRGLR